MAASKRSELSVDIDGKRSTKEAGKKKRLPNWDNDLIIIKRVEKGLKRWKLVQTKIPEKQRKLEKRGHSKHLESYTKERNELVDQMQKDIPELHAIFDDDYSNEFDRKDKIRATTGGMRKEDRETLSLRLQSAESKISQLETERKSKEEALSRLEAKNNQLITQLENERKDIEDARVRVEATNNELTNRLQNERKANEDALVRLRSAESEINQVKSQLEKERKSKEEALSRLRSAESEINQLTSQLEKESKFAEEVLRLNKRLDESENEKVALKLNHTEEIGVQKEEIRKLQERLTIKKSYEERAKELKRKCDDLETELARSEKKLKEKERENETGKYRLEDEIRRTVEELERLEVKNNQLTTQVQNERKAKEDALLRLSSMASNKLRDNNPNIADLSDPNRPTKLSEQFSELYDNEWTDAFDELEKLLDDNEETNVISYLRDFVLEIHSVCSDLSLTKMKTIEEAFVKPSVPSENTKIPTEIFKTIKDGIKSMAPRLLEYTRELVLDRLKEKYLHDPVAGFLQHEKVKRYIDKCTEVCWYMSVQDPQLVMDGSKSPDKKFDSNKHREYTKKGPYEEFVVWPVLYLFKDGQMLSKGVAQGSKEMTGQQ